MSDKTEKTSPPWDEEDKTVVVKREDIEATELWSPDFLKQKSLANKSAQSPSPAKKEKPEAPFASTKLRPDLIPVADLSRIGQSLGKILLEISPLNAEQLADALAHINESGGGEDLLAEYILKKKWVTKDEILQARSLQLNIPIAPSAFKDLLETELIAGIPINYAKKFNFVPIFKDHDVCMIALFNPRTLNILDDLRLNLGLEIIPLLAWSEDITAAINHVYNQATRTNENLNQDLMEDLESQNLEGVNLNETEDLLDSEDEAPIIRLVNALLFQAVKDGASDIHIEPGEKDISVRFRIDGVLSEIMRPPKKAQNSISSRVKIMAQLDIAERRIPQDGRIKIKIGGRDVDIRVSTLPTSFGERIVMRLLDTASVLLDLKDLGFTPKQLTLMDRIIHLSHGIFLVTGPTGSGKSTTLYACLSKINSPERNIITVEDPVEIQLAGISQIQVNPKVNLTFASGLRSILRQDPDVVMVGEIRDKETAEISIQASMTGHMVFSTLHTNDAATTITRLMDMGVEAFKVADALEGVMAQRLARKLCKECKEPYTPTEIELKELGITQDQAHKGTFFRGVGCPTCGHLGYKGRTGIHELMPIDDNLKPLILGGADGGSIKKRAIEMGMRTLRDDGALKILEGQTSVEEILRVTQDEIGIEE